MLEDPYLLRHVDKEPTTAYFAACYAILLLGVLVCREVSVLAAVPLACMYMNGLSESSTLHFLIVLSMAAIRVFQ